MASWAALGLPGELKSYFYVLIRILGPIWSPKSSKNHHFLVSKINDIFNMVFLLFFLAFLQKNTTIFQTPDPYETSATAMFYQLFHFCETAPAATKQRRKNYPKLLQNWSKKRQKTDGDKQTRKEPQKSSLGGPWVLKPDLARERKAQFGI